MLQDMQDTRQPNSKATVVPPSCFKFGQRGGKGGGGGGLNM